MNRVFSFLYNCIVQVYSYSIRIGSVFNAKAGLWTEGRRNWYRKMKAALESDLAPAGKTAWFHCASLGEFEQGRPVIELFRERNPEYRILLTFFSPSGYEVRKNYPGADHIFYLPADTRKNAGKFLELVNPSLAFFIKYEYWFNYLQGLKARNISTFLVSGLFRNDHHFFRWYGGWTQTWLKCFDWFFVQDEGSEKLLRSIGFSNVTVTGDTRFDRVAAVAGQSRSFPLVELFCEGSPVIVAGSTWPEDESILFRFMEGRGDVKFIIAPHETGVSRVRGLMERCPLPALRLSEAGEDTVRQSRVLVIDSVGMLAHLYRFGKVALIGGGFGSGIHNILEAAVFGLPVIFGPVYEKFREATDLARMGGAFPVRTGEEFNAIVNRLLTDGEYYRECSGICMAYVKGKRGATQKILSRILPE